MAANPVAQRARVRILPVETCQLAAPDGIPIADAGLLLRTVRQGVRMASKPSETTTASKLIGNVASRAHHPSHRSSCSLQLPHQLTAVRVTQIAVGYKVQPATWIRRVPSSMKKSTATVFKRRASTVKK